MYTAGSNSFLGSKPRPLEVEGTLIVFSVLALNVRMHRNCAFYCIAAKAVLY